MKLFITIFFVTLFLNALAQKKNLDVYNLNFEELSKLKIVTASKTEQDITELTSTLHVITANEIRERAYFTLDEMLSDLPGFQFRNVMSLNSYVFQRGIPNQNNLTLILIDGLQVNELNSGGFYGGGQYNLSNIERVEVVYGPSSVAYGTNAVSGIINIITKNAKKNEGSFKTSIGNFNTIESDASVSFVNEEKSLGIKVSGMLKKSDKANLKGEAGDNNWTDLLDNFEDDYALDMKVNYKNFIFGTNYLNKQTSTATFQKSIGSLYKDYGTLWNIRFLNNYLKYNHQLTDKLNLSATLYNRNATVSKNTVYYVVDTAQISFYRPNNLTGIESILNYNLLANVSFTGGLVLEYEQLAEGPAITQSNSSLLKPPTPEKPAMDNNFLASVFIEPRFMFFDHLYISGGLRFDQSTVYNQVITPRAGIRYNAGKHSARISYAEAYRAPKPWDYSDGIGNTNLTPERMKSFEASIMLMLSKSIKIDLTAYQNRLENGIVKELVNDDYRWTNSSEFNTNGFEVYAHYSTQKIRSTINYTFTNSLDENEQSLSEISKHTANASLTYLFSKSWKLNLRANYVGKRENPSLIETTNNYVIDPYLIFNGALTWIYSDKITCQLTGKNLLNSEYYHSSNRSPDRYRQAQRTMLFSVVYNFDH